MIAWRSKSNSQVERSSWESIGCRSPPQPASPCPAQGDVDGGLQGENWRKPKPAVRKLAVVPRSQVGPDHARPRGATPRYPARDTIRQGRPAGRQAGRACVGRSAGRPQGASRPRTNTICWRASYTDPANQQYF